MWGSRSAPIGTPNFWLHEEILSPCSLAATRYVLGLPATRFTGRGEVRTCRRS